MKKSILLVLWVLSHGVRSQSADSVFIYYQKDEMENKTSYYPSAKIALLDKPNNRGFSVSAFIDESDNVFTIKDLCVKMVNIGACVENNNIIFLFEDGSKIFLNSWNDFNCDGDAWFRLGDGDSELLSKKKIAKIKISNGRSFESMTAPVPPKSKDYFIQLYRAMKQRKLKELKD